MVKGKAAVKWDAGNDAKLLQAFAAIHAITPNYERIAAVFGPNVPKEAIQYRWGVLRKAGGLLSAGAGSSPTKATPTEANTAKVTTPTRTRAPSSKKPDVKRKRGGIHYDPLSDDESTAADDTGENEGSPSESDDAGPVNPGPSAKRQKTMGGKVTKRISPRAIVKKDYKKIEDPFVDMENAEDEDGNAIFQEESVTGDNSADDDGDYGHATVVVKAEVDDEDVA